MKTNIETLAEVHPDRLYSLTETVRVLPISARSVRRRVRDGSLPSRRMGNVGRLVFLGADLLAFAGWAIAQKTPLETEGERKRRAAAATKRRLASRKAGAA